MKATELLERMKSNNVPLIVDARSELEFRKGHIPGAINAPVRKILLRRAPLPQDKSREMVITCEHGQRATAAKLLLATYGYPNVALLEGFLQGWREAGLPLDRQYGQGDETATGTRRDPQLTRSARNRIGERGER